MSSHSPPPPANNNNTLRSTTGNNNNHDDDVDALHNDPMMMNLPETQSTDHDPLGVEDVRDDDQDHVDEVHNPVNVPETDQDHVEVVETAVKLSEVDLLGFDDVDESLNPVKLSEVDPLGFADVDESLNPVELPEIDRLGLDDDDVEALQNQSKLTETGASGVESSDAVARARSKGKMPAIDRSEMEEEEGDNKKKQTLKFQFGSFPPNVAIMNKRRPKYEFESVRKNGRLQLFLRPPRTLSPKLVRSPDKNGRVQMFLANGGEQGGGGLPTVRRSI